MDTAATVRGDFATRLYDRVARTRPGKNLFLSPFSIQVALAMCAAGARGPTRQVMAELIGAPANVEEQNRQYAELLKAVNAEEERTIQLLTANALWWQAGYHFNPDYKQAIADFYGGAFNEVDFVGRPDEAVRTINAWVEDTTREKIKDLIRRDVISSDTRLILTNAIYFKGQWASVFRRDRTTDEDWHGPGGTRKVPTMHQGGGHFYYEGKDLQALDLLYQGGELSMLIVLPRRPDGLAALEAAWAAGDTYRRVVAGLRSEPAVMIWLPRFKVEAAFDLGAVLRELGAGLAFSDRADFGGIGEEPLKISEVVHKAFVDVNEEGTEAAAATAVAMRLAGFALPQEPKVFRADHPFLFFIRQRKTGAVLFTGRLLEPE
jgi:serpin B